MKMVIGKSFSDRYRGGNKTIIKNNSSKSSETFAMEELKSKRGINSKLYACGKAKMVEEFHCEPVHFFNETSGQLEEIDARLRDCGAYYSNTAGLFKSKFNKRIKGGKIFEMEKGPCKIALKSCDAERNGEINVEVNDKDNESFDRGRAVIRNVKSNTDIEYLIKADRIKENIIVRERSEKYEYEFELTLENIAVDISEDGKRVELMRKDSGMVDFYIPAPVMFDAVGETSDSLYYELEQQSDKILKLKVVADADWINDDNRSFPVTIDPQIITTTYAGPYYYSSNYASSMFKYKVVTNGVRNDGEPKIYYNDETKNETYTEIIIWKNRLPSYILNNFTSIKLKLRAKSGAVIQGLTIGTECIFGTDDTEFLVDVTSFFCSDEDAVTINVTNNSPRDYKYENNACFYAPTLLIEYVSKLSSLTVTTAPNKTAYIPGDAFDPTGMAVRANYEDGRSKALSLNQLEIEPSGALAAYDTDIRIKYSEDDEYIECTYPITVSNEDYWFNDRRAPKDMENIYLATPVNSNGQPSTAESYFIRLELADGIAVGSEQEGTPLNAQTFNKLIKILKEKNILD